MKERLKEWRGESKQFLRMFGKWERESRRRLGCRVRTGPTGFKVLMGDVHSVASPENLISREKSGLERFGDHPNWKHPRPHRDWDHQGKEHREEKGRRKNHCRIIHSCFSSWSLLFPAAPSFIPPWTWSFLSASFRPRYPRYRPSSLIPSLLWLTLLPSPWPPTQAFWSWAFRFNDKWRTNSKEGNNQFKSCFSRYFYSSFLKTPSFSPFTFLAN